MDNTIKTKFDKLCKDECLSHKLTGYGYYAFLNILEEREEGRFATEEEIASDFTALEIARMLQRIYNAKEFCLEVDGERDPKPYSSPVLVSILSDTLIKKLQELIRKSPHSIAKRGGIVVEDYGAVMYLNKFAGKDGRVSRIPYPENVTPFMEDGFSREEIDAIIKYESAKVIILKKFKGNKTKSPELGHLCELLLPFFPDDWIQEDRYYFLFEFLVLAGFLDFRGPNWISINEDKSKNQKRCMVKDWIRAYNKLKK